MLFKEIEIESDTKNETKNFIGIFDFVESHNRNKKEMDSVLKILFEQFFSFFGLFKGLHESSHRINVEKNSRRIIDRIYKKIKQNRIQFLRSWTALRLFLSFSLFPCLCLVFTWVPLTMRHKLQCAFTIKSKVFVIFVSIVYGFLCGCFEINCHFERNSFIG